MPKIVTVTLMRKNSTRLPGKNTRLLGGKPLYQYTLDTARELGFPHVVYHNYSDLVLPKDVIGVRYHGNGIDMLRLSEVDAEIYVMLPVTSPFRSVPDIREAVGGFVDDKGAKVLIGVVREKPGLYHDENGRPLNFRSDDMPTEAAKRKIVYRECGSLYVFRRYQIDKMYFLNCLPDERRLYIDPVGVDLDTEADWQEAEAWLNVRG